MNTITRIILTALLIVSAATQMSAQFHTVTDTKVIKRKAQPTVEIPTVVPRPNKQVERTSHVLHAAHPLRKIHVTSPYGWRTDPFTKKKAFHNGIDLRANYEPAYAMFPGKVIRTGRNRRAGLYLTLRHGSITMTYCHLSRILVPVGTTVRPGSIVAITGNTGRSTAPHLHLSVKVKGKWVNPMLLWNR